jgi:hypothetical protein
MRYDPLGELSELCIDATYTLARIINPARIGNSTPCAGRELHHP